MSQTINVTTPIASLIGDLKDISSALAVANTPVADADDTHGFPLEAWNHIKRVTAMSQGNICPITTPELDRLIIGYTRCGILITYYQPSIGATIYRRPDGSVLAMSIGNQHFCHRDIRPVRSAALYVQTLGRAQRNWSNEYVKTPESLSVPFFPLLTKEGGAGEGASPMTTALLAKYFGVPLNFGGIINTALLTDGIETPDAAQ